MLNKAQIDEYNDRGFIVLPELLNKREVADLQAVTDRLVEESRSVTRNDVRFDLEPEHTGERPALRRIKTPHLHDEVYASASRHPKVIAALRSLWGDNIRFDTTKLNLKAAGVGSPVEWHQDWAYYPHTNDDLAAVGIMIDAFTPTNGAMLVIPGSHRGPVYDHHQDGFFVGAINVERSGVDVDEAVPLIAPAGSVSIHHVRLVHGSAANLSGAPRRYMLTQYRSADAWPLMGTRVNFPEYEALMVSGKSPVAPRMRELPIRIPLPQPAGYTTIYEIQDQARGKYFAPKPVMADQ